MNIFCLKLYRITYIIFMTVYSQGSEIIFEVLGVHNVN